MADVYTTATQLAVLLAGRDPAWAEQSTTDNDKPPQSVGSGVALSDTVRTLLYIALREDARGRTCRYAVTTVDLTATYGVTIDGNVVSYDANAGGAIDIVDVVEGIRDAILADAPGAADVVVATVEDSDDDGDADTVVIRGLGEADYSFEGTAGGTAVVALTAELVGADARVWYKPGTAPTFTAPTAWVSPGPDLVLTGRGYLERLQTGGLSRLFVQLNNRIGHGGDAAAGEPVTYVEPAVRIGPCILETS